MGASTSPDDIQAKLGYEFDDQSLLLLALTHTSYAAEHQAGHSESNERLEYLGDAILKAVIADQLMRLLQLADEGRLSKLSAQILSGRALAEAALNLGLQHYIRLGHGEETSGGRTRRRNLAGAMEAVIGAIYSDGGFGPARDFVVRVMEPIIERAISGPASDYKTALQEYVQSAGIGDLSYRTVRADGPSHRPWFTVEVLVGDCVIGSGQGSSKRAAEQTAARDGMERLGAAQ
ncbi:MAG: ribonuclease III [Bacillota bacterium]|jgi:ribonuclease-3